jgi:hypothetical protein
MDEHTANYYYDMLEQTRDKEYIILESLQSLDCDFMEIRR